MGLPLITPTIHRQFSISPIFHRHMRSRYNQLIEVTWAANPTSLDRSEHPIVNPRGRSALTVRTQNPRHKET